MAKILQFLKQFLLERIGTIILLVIVAVFLLIGSQRIKKARENAITYSNDYEAPEKTADLLQPGEYVSIANNGKLELFYNEVKGAIQVKDLSTGHLYMTIVDEEVYGKLKNSNKQWQANMQSAIHIKYNDLKKRDSGVKELYAGKDCGELTHEFIENGVAVTYGFLTPGIYVTVEYTIEDDELVVRVPYEKIRELSRFAVTTISVLPYIGACENNNDGYIFYPDGSGAISTYARVGERPASAKVSNYYTYSNRMVSFMSLYDDDSYDRYTASMPVYGIKDGDYAVFGYATKGAENTAIQVNTSGVVINLNRAGFDVFVRNIYNVNMYNVSTGKGVMATGGQVQRVDKQLIPEEKELRYAFLSGDKANYSGMAEVYRNYLIETGQLNNTEYKNDDLALEILMGTTKEGIIFDEYIAMTTFDEVIEILEKLKAEGLEKTKVVLKGWMKDYVEYNTWGPDPHLGGTAGLKKLSEYAQANGFDIYLQNGFVIASSKTKGIDQKRDVAYSGINIEISITNPDGVVSYLRNPYAIFKANEDFLKKFSKYKGLGIGYEYEGKYAYPDFNEWHPYLKAESVVQLQDTLAAADKEGRNIGVKGQNQYVFKLADYIYDIKEESYGLSITDYAVPFTQLVLSGRVVYSSGNAGNLSYDLQTQKLQWIEFGSMPYFYLTYKSALKLRDTYTDELFSSTYADWEPVMLETCKEFATNLASVKGQRMVGHEVVSHMVRKVTYENGVSIYVNYSDKAETVEGVTIQPKSYLVTGGER